MKLQKPSRNTIVVNGHALSFPMDIERVVALHDRIIILVDSRYWADTDPEGSRNVYCYGANGKLLWQIESSGVVEVEDDVIVMYLGYVDILYDAEKDELEAIGVEWDFIVDKDTGRIITRSYRGRY